MLALFPPGASLSAGQLQLHGVRATDLADRFGTPLVVYSEEAVRERARLFARAAPGRSSSTGRRRFRTWR